MTLRCASDFNPRPLAGATHPPGQGNLVPAISIHAPLRGRPDRGLENLEAIRFQSTPPCGGDGMDLNVLIGREDFNPRPLAGATKIIAVPAEAEQFQSTPPCGGDHSHRGNGSSHAYFNPRPLAGATLCDRGILPRIKFQSTPPCGGDRRTKMAEGKELIFQSTPPCGGDSTHY